jgi:molybdate transport system substrate-binding protein
MMNSFSSPTPGHRRVAAALALAALVMAAACGSSSTTTNTTATTADLTGTITVSAASSLKGSFGTLGTMFQSAHPGTTVSFNFGSSGTLATQIEQGAPADVFASASTQDMTPVQHAGDIARTPVIFARNSLEIVVKPGNPLGIHSLAGLEKAGVVSVCVKTAPCGFTADQALAKAHVTIPASKVTLGQDVDATLAEVTTGDADAAIVYVTNTKSVGTLGASVPIPASQNVPTSYPIAMVKTTKNKTLSQAWIAYVLSPTGQAVLRRASFLPAH